MIIEEIKTRIRRIRDSLKGAFAMPPSLLLLVRD